MNLFKAAASVSAMTFLSRVTGLAREIIGFNLFGAGAAMSVQATDTFFNTQMFLNAYGVTILDEQGRELPTGEVGEV